jgi:hypothetical protein
MFEIQYKDYFRNLKWLNKERHRFKSGEKYFVSLQNEKKNFRQKNFPDFQLHLYHKKLKKRLQRERKLFMIKMLLAILILTGVFYGGFLMMIK